MELLIATFSNSGKNSLLENTPEQMPYAGGAQVMCAMFVSF